MDPLRVYDAIQRDPRLGFARDTLAHIFSIFDTYGSDNVSLCFNGGKDCTVLLHLLAAALAHRGVAAGLASIPIVYFKFEEELPELDVFLSDCCRLYRFPLLTVTGATMKDCVASLLAQRPRTRAMFMGQRVGDPGSASLSLVSPSDPSWPPLDRVNSILHWSYQQVWTFLLSLRLPFCRLYELGYTSLGARALTVPNPLLLRAAVTAACEDEASASASGALASLMPSPMSPATAAAGARADGGAPWCPLAYAAAFQQGVPPAPEPYCPSLAAAAAAAAAAGGVAGDLEVGASKMRVPYLIDSCAYLFHYYSASEARRAAMASAAAARSNAHAHGHGHGACCGSPTAAGLQHSHPHPTPLPHPHSQRQPCSCSCCPAKLTASSTGGAHSRTCQCPSSNSLTLDVSTPLGYVSAHGNAGADCTALEDSAVAAALAAAAATSAAAAAAAAAAAKKPADVRGVVSVAPPPPTPFAHPLLRAVTPASVLWDRSAALPAAAVAAAAAREAGCKGIASECKGVDENARAFEWLSGTYNGSPEPHMPRALAIAQLAAEAPTLPASFASASVSSSATVAGAQDGGKEELVVLASGGGAAVRARWPFAPAWVLRDATYERAGRLQRPKKEHVQAHAAAK